MVLVRQPHGTAWRVDGVEGQHELEAEPSTKQKSRGAPGPAAEPYRHTSRRPPASAARPQTTCGVTATLAKKRCPDARAAVLPARRRHEREAAAASRRYRRATTGRRLPQHRSTQQY